MEVGTETGKRKSEFGNEKINFIHIAKNGGTSVKALIKDYPHLKLVYHSHNAPISKVNNQMLIIRHPFDRFCSAVQYAIENYSHSPKIKAILNAGIDTPSKWAEVWGNNNSSYHSLILEEVTNDSHSIDNQLIKYKWTYEPQSSWFFPDKVSYLIPMTQLEDRIFELFRKKLKNHNESFSHSNRELSERRKNFY